VHHIKQSGLVLAAIAAVTAPASADCSETCAAGAFGTGGSASDGAAQGFRLAATSIPGADFTNSRNDIAGHIAVSGTENGSGSGAFTRRSSWLDTSRGSLRSSIRAPPRPATASACPRPAVVAVVAIGFEGLPAIICGPCRLSRERTHRPLSGRSLNDVVHVHVVHALQVVGNLVG
jgi:hypothetical protein